MLSFNTMRYVTDTFDLGDNTPIQALLLSGVALNTKGCLAVKYFVIDGVEPAGTARRFMFRIDNKTYRFVNGTLTEYTGAINLANVLADGNSVDELATVQDLSALLDKNIYPIIALNAVSDAVAFPSVKFSIIVERPAA